MDLAGVIIGVSWGTSRIAAHAYTNSGNYKSS